MIGYCLETVVIANCFTSLTSTAAAATGSFSIKVCIFLQLIWFWFAYCNKSNNKTLAISHELRFHHAEILLLLRRAALKINLAALYINSRFDWFYLKHVFSKNHKTFCSSFVRYHLMRQSVLLQKTIKFHVMPKIFGSLDKPKKTKY